MLENFIAIAVGLALDFAFGDPRKMPHLVRLVGWLAIQGEKVCVASLGRTVFAGVILWIGVAGIGFGLYWGIGYGLASLHPWAKVLFEALIVFQCVAYRDLLKHVLAVKTGLETSLKQGRQRVSWIVGRDTDRMEEDDVCRAAIESGAENLNDAVIAPLFWAAIFGPMGALVFRISNTMDAMVGHRTERFEKLGKVSARIDDALNFIPARLCSLLLLKVRDWGSWLSLVGDATKHPSINAGWPEAAIARRLGVVIGGRMYERGVLVQTAEMNEGARQPDRSDVERATRLMSEAYAKSILLWVCVTSVVYGLVIY